MSDYNYELAATLVKDHEVTLPDGRTLRLVEEQDTDTSINDFECWGRVEYVASPYDRDGMRATRPKGFDGRAEKIVTGRGDVYWWQPTLELWGIEPKAWHNSAELRRSNRAAVRDILDYGYRLFTVEMYETCACCGTEKLVAWNAMGGVEPLLDDSDNMEPVADLVWTVLRGDGFPPA